MKKRNYGLDLLKVIAIYTVIIIHLPGVDGNAKSKILHWLPYANGCFAVLAGWFMYNGLFAQGDFSAGLWLRKRCARLLIPYFVWDIFHIALSSGLAMMHHEYVFPTLPQWRDMLFFGTGGTQFWFIISLFYAQIILIILCRLLRRVNGKLAGGGLLALAGVLLYLLPKSIPWQVSNVLTILRFSAMGLGVHVLADELPIRLSNKSAKVFIVSGCLVWIIQSHFVGQHGLWPIGILAWCLGFGVMGEAIEKSLQRMGALNLMSLVGNAVMGVYLCHWFVTRLFFKPMIPFLDAHIGGGVLTILGVAGSIFIASACLAIGLRKQKWLLG